MKIENNYFYLYNYYKDHYGDVKSFCLRHLALYKYNVKKVVKNCEINY